MATLDRKHLAMALSRVPGHPAPRADREQVQTPGEIAAQVLWAMADEGDLADQVVLDLGCGTGVLAIGAALLGAEQVVGLDIDEGAVAVARAAADAAGVGARCRFEVRDVASTTAADVHELVGGPVDTVVMNPPFGADRSSRGRGGDRVFLGLAFQVAPVIVSLHLAETQRFLLAFAQDAGFSVGSLGTVAFPLPARFAHHRSAVRTVPVGVYRFARDAARE